MRMISARFVAAAVLALVPALAFAQAATPAAPGDQTPATPSPAPATGPTICGVMLREPENLPPAGSGPVIWQIAPCWSAQGNVPTIDPQTYLFWMELAKNPSQPTQNIWVPYTEDTERIIVEDFQRLWATNFLEDLRIFYTDHVFSNGVVGRLITYEMEERERVRNITYTGTTQINRTQIEERLSERQIDFRLDDFVNNATIARIKGVLREMMAEKGFTNAEVTHEITAVAGGPKLVNVTFNTSEGPKIRIEDVEFVGNTIKSDRALRGQLKDNKPRGLLGFITGGGTWQEAKFEADADLVQQYLQNEGYARARVGQPELVTLRDSEDGKERWVRIRIPVTEGPRYRVGEMELRGNYVVTSEALRALFDIEEGEWYSLKKIQQGFQKARDVYGGGGYIEFTGFPEFRYSDDPSNPVPDALRGAEGVPTVDVTLQLNEGPQFRVNRITFVGNTTTRDNVIRRELGTLLEGNIFNMEALKYAVRRLNQLGYFEQINEQDTNAIKYERTPDKENMFDVTLTLREQNRNQLTFGAGVSQFEGLFGQLSFQTANFLGRGESLTVSLQAGDRAQNFQLAFTEPFLFDRNITGGFDVYKRSVRYIGYYTQKSSGGNIMFGFPLAPFTRTFFTYAYEQIKMTDLNEAFLDPSCVARVNGCSEIRLDDLSTVDPAALEALRRNPFVFDSLLIGAGGRRTTSRITPSLVHNTVDNPIFPNTGKRFTASVDLAVLGGNTQFIKPNFEALKFWRHTSRSSFGVRAQVQYITPVGQTETLPIFEKLFLGGEYSIRGFDIRSVGPSDPTTGLVLGGNKSLLFNAEYIITIAGPVRLILFYDAGQVRDVGQPFAMKEDVMQQMLPPLPPLFDPFTSLNLTVPGALGPQLVRIGETSAFKSSTGAEVRFMMPVLNVPFRLIFAHNPSRGNVLDNRLQPAKDFVFRFAVGSTF
jgi:outer membrane protein insertion porin family